MPGETITIQTGQCGNQIGLCFWELLLAEHAKLSRGARLDDALSAFFRENDAGGLHASAPRSKARESLTARCVIVDTEEGVIAQLLKSRLRGVFDARQIVSGASGAGNNWAHGFAGYGPKYRSEVLEKVRREAESCSSLQSFFLLHSLGGGTGSGLGTFILAQLADEYPRALRFTASVFPSHSDDVITSPYNALLAAQKLVEHADCVFPVDNDSLLALCSPKKTRQSTAVSKCGKGYFAQMNSIVAHLLSNVTCSTRYDGKLNVDLNEITANMVPFPRLHFLLSSMAPLQLLLHGIEPRGVDQLFDEVLLPENHLLTCAPDRHSYLAMALLARGAASFGDVARNVERVKQQVRMVWWNPDGFKYGLCGARPLYHTNSLLCLANSTALGATFKALRSRFHKLYARKVYVHHYTPYICEEAFGEAAECLRELEANYSTLEGQTPQAEPPSRYKRVV